MIIESFTSLTPEKEEEIRRLYELCNHKDGLTGNVYLSDELNFDRQIPAFYLGYEGECLAAFLMLFMPERGTAEVTAFTHPDYRKRGYFTALYQRAVHNCKNFDIFQMLLVADERSETGQAVLERMKNVKYVFSEYKMELKQKTEFLKSEDMRFERLSEENKNIYRMLTPLALEIDEECEGFLQAAMNNPLRKGYIAYWKEEAVGVFHINCEDGESCIYGVGISPEYRGIGLGNRMIQYAAFRAEKFGQPVVLEVDSENQRAFHLYCKNGFEIVHQMNYWSMPIVEERCM